MRPSLLNRINPIKEMVVGTKPTDGGFRTYREMVAAGKMTSRMEGNKSHARYHGLIAAVQDGEFVLTRKGARFLQGQPVSKTAIISKTSKSNAGYWNESETVTFGELMKLETPFWTLDYLTIDRLLTSDTMAMAL